MEGYQPPSVRRFKIGVQLEQFVGGRNAPGNSLALDASQVLADPQTEQAIV